jgi:hypothetical protein
MHRTGLLVSVRSADEATEAVDAGADLIDVKEPSRGSLGAPSAQVVAEVLAAVDGRRPVSVALGELFDPGATDPTGETRTLSPRQLDPAIRFAKLGLAGCARCDAWEEGWARRLQELPATTAAVAVVYADWPAAAAPEPRQVLAAARRLNCRAVLVDTFDKTGAGLTQLWSRADLQSLADAVRDHQLMLVLAGKISANDFDTLLPLDPDYLAVRGAACSVDRTGRLDPARVRVLRDRLRSARFF